MIDWKLWSEPPKHPGVFLVWCIIKNEEFALMLEGTALEVEKYANDQIGKCTIARWVEVTRPEGL